MIKYGYLTVFGYTHICTVKCSQWCNGWKLGICWYGIFTQNDS